MHPVDEVLATPRLFTLGIQHVLVMYAGAIAVPLIIGRALKLDPEQVAFLISADLFVCGLVTLIQSLGVAVSIGFGMIPLVAPDFKMWLPHGIHPLVESGILLASVSAVVLNAFFNGTGASDEEIREAAMAAEA